MSDAPNYIKVRDDKKPLRAIDNKTAVKTYNQNQIKRWLNEPAA